MYFKIVNPIGHYGMIYKEGINTDILPFDPSGDCESGGIYFSKEDILAFCNYGTEVYSVEPIGEVYENPGSPKKWKAHSINLTYIGKLWDVKTFKFLIEHGVNVHVDRDKALRGAASNGCLEVVKILVENGADIHAQDDEALRYASIYGHFEVVKFLVENGANIQAQRCEALRFADTQEIKDYLQSIIDKN